MKKILLVLTIFIFFPFKVMAFLNITMSPEYVILDVEKPTTQEIVVTNQTDKFLRYRISTVKPDTLSQEYYIGDELIIYPKVISLKPRGKQTIRMRMKKRLSSEGKDFITKIRFQELTGEQKKDVIKEEGNMNLSVSFNVDIEIYILGLSKKTEPSIKITEVDIEDVFIEDQKKESNKTQNKHKILKINAKNISKQIFYGKAEIIDIKTNKKLIKKTLDTIYQGNTKIVKLDLTKIPSERKVKIVLYDRRSPDRIMYEKKIDL